MIENSISALLGSFLLILQGMSELWRLKSQDFGEGVYMVFSLLSLCVSGKILIVSGHVVPLDLVTQREPLGRRDLGLLVSSPGCIPQAFLSSILLPPQETSGKMLSFLAIYLLLRNNKECAVSSTGRCFHQVHIPKAFIIRNLTWFLSHCGMWKISVQIPPYTSYVLLASHLPLWVSVSSFVKQDSYTFFLGLLYWLDETVHVKQWHSVWCKSLKTWSYCYSNLGL